MEAQNYKRGDVIDYTASAEISAGQVLQVAGRSGVATSNIANGDKGVVQVKGLVKVVKKNEEIAAGATLYWDEDGDPYGGTAGSGAATAVKADGDFILGSNAQQDAAEATDSQVVCSLNEVALADMVDAPAQTSTIWVDGGRTDPYTADGSFEKPYKTIDAAQAAMTNTKNHLCILPADYTLSDELSLGVYDQVIEGIGSGVNITSAAAADSAFKIAPAATTATNTYTFRNFTLTHAANVGIQVDNENASNKIILDIKDVEFGTDTGNSIDVDHAATDDAVKIYMDNGGKELEGAINFVVGNASDMIRINNARLTGGLVTGTGDYAAEILLRNSIIKHEGVTGGHASQTVNVIACVSDAAYAPVDTADLAGSHTENIVAFD